MVFAIGLGVCTILSGCFRSRDRPGVLVVGLESAPTDLDPRFATDAASARIDDLVFRSLTRLDERRQHVPDIALDWALEDRTTARFDLRRDVTFSDGTPLRAADVQATYESVLDPRTGSPKRGDLAFLEAVDAPDDHTVRFHFSAPFAAFLEATTLGIVPAAELGSGHRVLIGAGPYRVAEMRSDREVRLVARPDHGGIPEIRFRVVPDDTVRALELKNGSLDLVENAVEPDNVAWLEKQPGICVRRIAGTTFQYLGLNFADPRLRDVRVRRAIAHAIDTRALIDHLLGGAARPATGLLSPEHWAYAGDVTTYDYDPARAKRLLDEAGYHDPDGDGPAVRLTLTYKTSTLESRRRIGEALQAMLAEVGIGLEVRSFEWATFYDDVRRGNFQLYSLAWIGVNDPDFHFTWLNSTMVPPRGNNRGRYSDPETDRLTLDGRQTLDPLKRQTIYRDVQRRSAEDLPFIPLWWTDNVVVHDDRLCGFAPEPDGSLESLARSWVLPGQAAAGTRPSPCGCGKAS